MAKISFTILVCVWLSLNYFAQSNLLKNPSGDEGADAWKAFGDARIESLKNNGPHFVVRNSGKFHQVVQIETSMIGKFALLIARGSSERINANGSITGLPYLYGYFLAKHAPNGGVVNEYLQGQYMRARPRSPEDWTVMHGIFEIPPKTVAVQFMLHQAERKDDPQDGSAARFDDVGFFVFDTRKEAIDFAGRYLK